MKATKSSSMRAKGLLEAGTNPMGRPETQGFRNLVSGLIVAVFTSGFAAAGCAGETADRQTVELYRQGNLLYEGGKYAEASRTYERIIERGIRNGHVYYNLGNAYYRQDQIGRAILAYERASRLMPRDVDLRSNLDLANERTTDRIAVDVPWFGRQALDAVTVNQATAAATAAGFLASLALVFYLLATRPRTRSAAVYALLATSLVLLMVIGFMSIKIYDDLENRNGIVLSPVAVVRTSPDASSEPVFTLHEGAKVQLVEHRDEWTRIRLPDGKNGWLSREDLEGI